jgi:very-short-patch-repair endonuclease
LAQVESWQILRCVRLRRDPVATERARELRAHATEAERRLWSKLRGHRLDGYKFRRQYPIGKYIADFACRSEHLLIELDGGGHGNDQAESDDAERTAYLEMCGYRTLRFWNLDVLADTVRVAEVIRAALGGAEEDPLNYPLPNPPA